MLEEDEFTIFTVEFAMVKKVDGQGTLVKNEKILGIPSYDDAGTSDYCR